MTVHGNGRWRIADLTAAFLSVDRDVCRRAFYGEPLDLVSAVVDSVRSWEDEPDYDPEKRIEDWARDVGAGLYDEKRSGQNDFTPLAEVVADTFLHLAFERPELDHKPEYRLYLACVRLEQDRVGRELTPSELERFTRRFYAPSYRRDLETISSERWEELFSELEQEDPRTHKKRPPERKVG